MLFHTLRDVFTYWRAIGWPLLWMPLLVWGAATGLNAQLRHGWDAEPLRLAVFTESPAPGLLAWLATRSEVALRTDVEPMHFRQLVAADSLDAAWIVEAGYAEALADGQRGSIDQYSNPQATHTELRLERLLAAYRDHTHGAPAPVRVARTPVSNGFTQLLTWVQRSVYALSLVFGLSTALYVLAFLLYGYGPHRQVVLVALGWGLLSLLLTFAGLALGLTLSGDGAALLRPVVGELLQPLALVKWGLVSTASLWATLSLAVQVGRFTTSYRITRGLLRFVLLGLLGGAVWAAATGAAGWPLLGWIAAGVDGVSGAGWYATIGVYLGGTLVLGGLAWMTLPGYVHPYEQPSDAPDLS